MTDWTPEALSARKAIKLVLDGSPPNGIQPSDCGLWAHVVAEVYNAHAAGGPAEARNVFAALAGADRGIAALLAEDPSAADAWAPPIPLNDTGPLPTFPVSVFPDWLRAFVTAEAEATQTPADLAAMLGLAVLATACQRRVAVAVRSGWREPVNLFTLVCLPPGHRKSAVFADMTAPLVAFEQAEIARLSPAVAVAQSDRKVLEAKLSRAQSAASSPKQGEDPARAMEEARELARELAAHRPPTLPRLIVDDATPEVITSLLAEQGGRLAVLSPEGGIFDILAGRYSQGAPNFEVLLKGHAGDTLRVDRRSRPAEFIASPTLTVGLCVQPEVLHRLAQRPGFRGRGLLGRFLYSLPVSALGRRRVDAPPVPRQVRAAYGQRVTDLLAIEPATDDRGDAIPHDLRLAPDADTRLLAFAAEIEPRLSEWGDLGTLTDWGSKLVGAVARVAGLLHMAASGPRWREPIAASTVDAAIAIGRYLIEHARTAFAQMGADEGVSAALKVLRWVERNGQPTFTKRDAFEGLKSTFLRADALDAPLALLEAHGYVRRQPAPAGKAGRPSFAFEVNPLALRASQNAQNAQNAQSPVPVAFFANDVAAPEEDPADEDPVSQAQAMAARLRARLAQQNAQRII